jgi:outer membrane protein, heavy metal efflux system
MKNSHDSKLGAEAMNIHLRATAALLLAAFWLAAPVRGAQVPKGATPERPLAAVVGTGQSPEPKSAPAASAGVTLKQLVQEALERNPEIQSAARRVRAMRARVPQVRALPDPTVAVGWMGRITPFSVMNGDPSSYRSVSAMQEIPYPGKLKLRGQMADREAAAARWDYERVRRRVVAQVKGAYYDYFYYQKALEITRKDQELLEKLAKIAEVRYQVGKGIQQDVLRAQVELSRLLGRLTVLNQQEKTARARLNTLLFRDPEAPLPPPAPFQQAAFPYSLEELYQMARQNDPQLQSDARLIERSQYAVNLAEKEYRPNFTVGYMYQQRPDMQDMHGFTVGINIPIFYRSKQREGVIEATEEMIGARREMQNQLTGVYFEVKQQYLAAQASEGLVRLYSQAIVPQSSLALDSSMASYEVGKVDFLSLLDNFSNVLDYEINYYRELSNFQIALARLEPLVGRELTK